MSREQLQNLTEPMFYLLLAMQKPRHGYDAMQYIEQVTEGRVKVGAGTVYALLSRFEKEHILEQLDEDGRRKIYTLTEKGRKLLDGELRRLLHLLADAQKMSEEAETDGTK